MPGPWGEPWTPAELREWCRKRFWTRRHGATWYGCTIKGWEHHLYGKTLPRGLRGMLREYRRYELEARKLEAARKVIRALEARLGIAPADSAAAPRTRRPAHRQIAHPDGVPVVARRGGRAKTPPPPRPCPFSGSCPPVVAIGPRQRIAWCPRCNQFRGSMPALTRTPP